MVHFVRLLLLKLICYKSVALYPPAAVVLLCYKPLQTSVALYPPTVVGTPLLQNHCRPVLHLYPPLLSVTALPPAAAAAAASLYLDGLVQTDEGFATPSKIQRKAVPQILAGGNIVLAAETGSGKTLAYLLPVIQQLKAQEVVNSSYSMLLPLWLWLICLLDFFSI